jgi:LuxR family maltose regulon positive regulatory protein
MEAHCLVTRLGPTDWFTMHPLVLSVLRAELASASPDRVPRLHLAAAAWYEHEGDVRPALEHLLLADEPRRALRLLAANHASLYDRGNEAAIRDTIAAIPSSVAMDDVEAIIELAWCQFLVDRHSFSETVSHLAWRAEQSGLDEIATSRVILLQSIDATLAGDWGAGAPLARSAQQAFGEHSWRDPIVRFSWNMVAREIALDERWDDASDEVSAIDCTPATCAGTTFMTTLDTSGATPPGT